MELVGADIGVDAGKWCVLVGADIGVDAGKWCVLVGAEQQEDEEWCR